MNELNSDFIASIFHTKGRSSLPSLINEFENRKKNSHVLVRRIRLDQTQNWYFDSDGNFRHVSGSFFSIRGLITRRGFSSAARQIIIDQPEVGILGIISKKIEGYLHFLMQYKFEPGNLGRFQLSPTVQATKSNYTAVHKGTPVPHLFRFTSSESSCFDIALSEQAGRFFRKTNRNIINRYSESEKIETYHQSIWLTLGEILELIKYNNLVNMNTRSIISCIRLGGNDSYTIKQANDFYNALCPPAENRKYGMEFFISALNVINPFVSLDELTYWIYQVRKNTHPMSELVPLKEILPVDKKAREIAFGSPPDFKIIALKIEAEREVSSWCQPIVIDSFYRLHGFLVKKINGILHFLVKVIAEAGNVNGAEIGPTVQGVPQDHAVPDTFPFLKYFIGASKKNVLLSVNQSDEGGRFYKVQNRHLIVLTNEDFELPEDYKWATLYQIKELIHLGLVNIEARSVISCINYKE